MLRWHPPQTKLLPSPSKGYGNQWKHLLNGMKKAYKGLKVITHLASWEWLHEDIHPKRGRPLIYPPYKVNAAILRWTEELLSASITDDHPHFVSIHQGVGNTTWLPPCPSIKNISRSSWLYGPPEKRIIHYALSIILYGNGVQKCIHLLLVLHIMMDTRFIFEGLHSTQNYALTLANKKIPSTSKPSLSLSLSFMNFLCCYRHSFRHKENPSNKTKNLELFFVKGEKDRCKKSFKFFICCFILNKIL